MYLKPPFKVTHTSSGLHLPLIHFSKGSWNSHKYFQPYRVFITTYFPLKNFSVFCINKQNYYDVISDFTKFLWTTSTVRSEYRRVSSLSSTTLLNLQVGLLFGKVWYLNFGWNIITYNESDKTDLGKKTGKRDKVSEKGEEERKE